MGNEASREDKRGRDEQNLPGLTATEESQRQKKEEDFRHIADGASDKLRQITDDDEASVSKAEVER